MSRVRALEVDRAALEDAKTAQDLRLRELEGRVAALARALSAVARPRHVSASSVQAAFGQAACLV